jgi:hypothetical protein
VDLVLANAGIVAAAAPGSSSSSAGIASLADNLWVAAHTNIMGERLSITVIRARMRASIYYDRVISKMTQPAEALLILQDGNDSSCALLAAVRPMNARDS